MTSSLLLAAAIYCFALAAFHLAFWRLLGWPRSLAGSGSLNVSVTQTLKIMLTLGVVMYGAALCWGALHPERSVWALPAAAALFLSVRTAVQPFQFPMRISCGVTCMLGLVRKSKANRRPKIFESTFRSPGSTRVPPGSAGLNSTTPTRNLFTAGHCGGVRMTSRTG